jgi:hypothetical protein
MSTTPRTPAQRRIDTLAVLEQHGSAWLATAGSREPRLIAVTATWTGEEIVVATRTGSPTARNLVESRRAILAFGTGDDAILVTAELIEAIPATADPGQVGRAFIARAGWNPAEEGPDWAWYRLRPTRIEAYRGYAELPGRTILRDGAWVA